jgi:pimeloyl-ACP methyl ester carboxylesterase
MAFAISNGIHIFYELHGQGEPLVLISGMGSDHAFWQFSLPVLAAHYQVLVFDTRGCGQTDAPQAAYSMPQLADDLAGLLDAVGWSSAHVLGFSMGGSIALSFALRYPGRVRRLVLAASFAGLNPQTRLFLDALLAVYEAGASHRHMFGLLAPWLASAAFLAHPENAAALQFDDNQPYPQPMYAWRNQYLAQRPFEVLGQLPQLQAPALVLAGQHDRLAHAEDAALLARHIPQAQLLVLAAGHLLNYEQPAQFHEAVLTFLG